jgi:hypothetical protein
MLAGLFFHLSLVCLSAEFHNNKTLLTIRFPFEQKEKKKSLYRQKSQMPMKQIGKKRETVYIYVWR